MIRDVLQDVDVLRICFFRGEPGHSRPDFAFATWRDTERGSHSSTGVLPREGDARRMAHTGTYEGFVPPQVMRAARRPARRSSWVGRRIT
jgi:hypothetical protein